MTNELIEKMAEAIWIADHADTDTWEGGKHFEKLAFIGMAEAAHACIPQVTKEQMMAAFEPLVKASKAYLTGPCVDSKLMNAWDSARGHIIEYPESTYPREVFECAVDEIESELREALATIPEAVKVILDTYPNGFWVDD